MPLRRRVELLSATLRRVILRGSSTVSRDGWLPRPPIEPLPVIPVTGQELEGLAIEDHVRSSARTETGTDQLARRGVPTEIDNREVNVVQATTPKGGTVALLFRCGDRVADPPASSCRFSASPVGRLVTRGRVR